MRVLGEVCYGSASASSSKHVERTVSSLSFSVSPFVLLFPPALPPFLARVSPHREMTLVEGWVYLHELDSQQSPFPLNERKE